MRIATVAISALAGLMMASPALALTVEANVSTELQEKFKDDFGLRESKILTEALTKKVTHIFEQKGVNADRVVVTIKDVKASRPTMEQVSNKPGLDPMRSISLGGAQVTGIAYDASGKEIGSYEYKWFENSLENSLVATTWTDARTSFDRFARRFADKLG